MPARILVVEDDADLLLAVALRLKSAGHTVLNAMDGRTAEAEALSQKPDLILMDIGLPGRNGHEVAEALRTHDETRDTPIIFLTARHEMEYRLRAAEANCAGYIVKPCFGDKLLQMVDSVLETRRLAAGPALEN